MRYSRLRKETIAKMLKSVYIVTQLYLDRP